MSANVIGVDMGGTKILSAVIDAEGNILGTAKVPTKADKGASEVIDRIADCVQKAIDKSGVASDSIQAIGIGAPGPLDPETGIVISRTESRLEGCSPENRVGNTHRLSNLC